MFNERCNYFVNKIDAISTLGPLDCCKRSSHLLSILVGVHNPLRVQKVLQGILKNVFSYFSVYPKISTMKKKTVDDQINCLSMYLFVLYRNLI